jgi:signal transduction histidine kinase
MSNATILIVEDEPIIAMDIQQSLHKIGYEVAGIANSAQVALDLVARSRPDLILMDICLSGATSGIQAADYLQKKLGYPVIFLTGHSDSRTFEEAKEANPFGYIRKPFESNDLRIAIEVALQRNQVEVAVRQAMSKVQELSEMKSKFIALVSHEFRNPLSSILLSLELIDRQNPPQLTQERKHLYVQRSKNAVAYMNQLLEGILVAGEVEAGVLGYNPAPLHLVELCQELVDQLQNDQTNETIILFTTQNFNEVNGGIYLLDEKLLRHILINLLSNAIKYSPNGNTVSFDLSSTENSLIFQIQDQGIGIPESDQAKLFEFFYRGENVKMIKGTGIGLAIVKQCVDLHQGNLDFHSQVGVGTTFTITLFY